MHRQPVKTRRPLVHSFTSPRRPLCTSRKAVPAARRRFDTVSKDPMVGTISSHLRRAALFTVIIIARPARNLIGTRGIPALRLHMFIDQSPRSQPKLLLHILAQRYLDAGGPYHTGNSRALTRLAWFQRAQHPTPRRWRGPTPNTQASGRAQHPTPSPLRGPNTQHPTPKHRG